MQKIIKADKLLDTVKKTNDSVRNSTQDILVAKTMATTLASTTVRVFGPVLGLFAIGAIIDFNFGLRPWGMITGTILGTVVAGILVYIQIRSIKKENL